MAIPTAIIIDLNISFSGKKLYVKANKKGNIKTIWGLNPRDF
jgi:hypothetical protein